MQQQQQLPELDFKRKIKLGYSKVHGRGVFATQDIEPGELIERAPLLVLGFRMNYHKDPIIWGYMFTNTCPCDECKRHGGHFLMVLGYCQLYNHMDDNTAQISFDLKNHLADITALKKIKKGEEIFINYGPKYFNNRDKFALDPNGNPIPSPQDKEQQQSKLEAKSDSCTTQVFRPI